MPSKIVERATDPKQYDRSDILWTNAVEANSLIKNFYFSYLLKFKKIWKGASILEIGCGSGWLLRLLKDHGAKSVEGIEPSEKNIKSASYKNLKIYPSDLASFKEKKKYDVVISVMTLGHIKNLNSAFKKMASLTKENGTIIIIVAAYEYFTKQREGWKLKVEDLKPGECAIQITSGKRKIAEIVREIKVYEQIAKKAGFTIEDSLPMVPTDSMMKDVPRLASHKGKPITYILRLRK